MGDEQLATLVERLRRIEEMLAALVAQRTVKDWYSTAEVASLLGKAEFTVREWCRRGRIRADKRACGRGLSQEWIIAHAELERYRNSGLLPSQEGQFWEQNGNNVGNARARRI